MTGKDRLKEITESIETGIREMFQSDKYQQYLRTMYQRGTDEKEAAAFIRNEYGTGGRSFDFLNGTHGFVDYRPSSGIIFNPYGDGGKVTLKWPAVEKRLREIIREGSYLTEGEKAQYQELESSYAGLGSIPMQRYLQHETIQHKGLAHFDSWASTFGETTTAIELAPEGTGYRARTRFAKFFNLPELMGILSSKSRNVIRETATINGSVNRQNLLTVNSCAAPLMRHWPESRNPLKLFFRLCRLTAMK